MKKLLIILLVTALAGNAVYAQSAKALRKEREAIIKDVEVRIER